jgi:prevent-host-death family protein
MKVRSSHEARKQLHALAKSVEATDEPVLLTRRGKPVAALISASDLEWFEQLEREARDRDAATGSAKGADTDSGAR